MRKLRADSLLPHFAATILLVVSAAIARPASAAGCEMACDLGEHNRLVLTEYIVNNNTVPLDDSALESFFAVTPAGIETREQVLSTNGNLDVTALDVFTYRIEVNGDTAVLAGKIVGTGTLGGRPMPDLNFLTVYTKVGDEWQLMARSLVPMFGPASASD